MLQPSTSSTFCPASATPEPSYKTTDSTSLDTKQSRERKYDSYCQYISEHVQIEPEYEWLLTFLREPGPSTSSTEVTVFEMVGDTLSEMGPFANADETFLKAVDIPQSGASTRMIIVEYEESWQVDRAIIDRLALLYDVDPVFLRRHFFYHFIREEDANDFKQDLQDPIEHRVYRLPHDALGNQFHFSNTREYNKLSVYHHVDTTTSSTTVLLWLRNSRVSTDASTRDMWSKSVLPSSVYALPDKSWKPVQSLASACMPEIRQMCSGDRGTYQETPLLLLYPYLRRMLLMYYESSQDKSRSDTYQTAFSWLEKPTAVDCEDILYELVVRMVALNEFENELRRLQTVLGPTEHRFYLMQADASSLQQKLEKSADFWREARGTSVFATQQEETRAAAEATRTINKLSSLAFIFVPLSFTASFFGMNVSAWGQGTVPLRTFFVTAVVIGMLSLVPIAPSIARTIAGSGMRTNTEIVFCLLRRSPRRAISYANLCLYFQYPVLMAVCGDILSQAFNVKKRGDHDRPWTRNAAYELLAEAHYSQEFLADCRETMLELEAYGKERMSKQPQEKSKE